MESESVRVGSRATRLGLRVRELFDLDGGSRYPLAVLFGLNLVDEFDRITFNTLTPEIREAFELSDTQVVAVGSLTAVFVFLAALPLGYVADRVNRVRFSQGAAIVWALMLVLVAGAWALPVLFGARFLGGIARSSNEIVHTGLLADLYEPRTHPRVFQLHRMANSIALVFALVAGAIGAAAGWRLAFLVLALPTFALVAASMRLREPVRGQSIDATAALERAGQRPPGVRETARLLLRVRSLRRLWGGALLMGTVLLTFSQLLSLFFEHAYDFGPAARGAVQFLQGLGTFTGVIIGGNYGLRLVRADRLAKIPGVLGAAFAVNAAGIALLAVAPWWPLSLFFLVVVGMAGGVIVPLLPSLIVRITPAIVRSQAYSYIMITIGLGGMIGIPLAGLGESIGYRATFLLVAVVFIPIAYLWYSAGAFVDADVRAADDALRVELADRLPRSSSPPA